MKTKKIIVGIIIFSILCMIFSQIAFAKYILADNINLKVFIDKTPPVINLTSNNINEEHKTSDLENVIKDNTDITITTSDNVKIKTNEYIYNPSEKNFNDKEVIPFETGKIFTEEGYYKIIATDTSSNKTEIIFLIDKTPPTVNVKFYKKGEEPKIANSKQVLVAAAVMHLMTENTLEKTEEKDETENIIEEKSMPQKATARSTTYVTSESELRNAINNRIDTIYTRGSINIYSSIDINYAVTIRPATNENALRYGGYGNFFNIKNGGFLTLTSMVVDCASNCRNRGVIGINVNTGGSLQFTNNSIIDAGGNTGILVNTGATTTLYSSTILGGSKGIVVKGNGSLIFRDEGKDNQIWGHTTGISFEDFSGTCNLNQSNIKIRNNTNGIIKQSGNGTLNISSAEIYSNSANGIIFTSGITNITGGSIYSNGKGINFGNGSLNIKGGTIRNNTTGILLNNDYSGKMTMTGGSIYSNTKYAINHAQSEDGNCTILGGSISGKIYLALDDNYINTNDKYTSFEVTPSKYFFKRKLVKTNSNECANTEIEKVTLTKNGDWYKYVNNDEYIVVWKGCNVRVNYIDYYGKVIKTDLITGNLGDTYETTSEEIDGYDLISTPENSKGTFTEKDITVEYKYDLKNIAIVNYEELLSGILSAKFWYNENSEDFSGDGTDFENNRKLEDYGYYKVIVINGVGLQKEITFLLNRDSIKR